MKRLTLYLLSFLVIIGAALRIYQFDFQGLMCDESYTLMVAKMPFLEILKFTLFNDCNPPVYYLFAHAAYIATGFADVAIRVPSIIFGILTIPAMYSLGEMFRFKTGAGDGERVGLLAAAITTVLFPLVYYSQFARSYALLVLAFTVFFTIFIYIRRTTKNITPELNAPIEDYFLLGIIGGACVWIHLFAIIPVAATIMTFFWTSANRNAIRASIAALLVMSPLIPLYFVTSSTRSLTLTWGMSLSDFAVYTPVEFFNYAFYIMMPLIILGAWFNKDDKLIKELSIIAIATLTIGIAASTITPAFSRYFFPLMPVFIVFISIAMSGILSKVKKLWARPIIVGGFLLVFVLIEASSFFLHYTYYRHIC